jgi:hypothetical protein
MATKKKTKKTARKMVNVLIGNGSYGLWIGKIDVNEATPEQILASKIAHVYECRNIRYWYGPTGGITSLVAYGPNPADLRNRIGAPVEGWVSAVVSVLLLAPTAVANFAKVTP